MLNLSPSSLEMFANPINYAEHCNSQMNHEQYYVNSIVRLPGHLNQLPSTDTLETDYSFNIDLNSETAGKTSWMFSQKLKKVFVKINSDLLVYINYNPIVPHEELFIRAMIVYTSPSDLAEPVKKCPNHREKSAYFPEHILTCSVPGTIYVGNESGKLFKDKLAVLIPLSGVIQNEPLKFQFSCSNSCSGGMNRKMTSIIFTLENRDGEIYGRESMSFKVCSCPKRDKEKDEEGNTKTLPKKRKSENVAPSTSKKVAMTVAMPVAIVKQESDSTVGSDTALTASLQDEQSIKPEIKSEPNCVVPSFSMPCPEMKKMVLTTAYNAVAGELLKTGDAAKFQPYLNEIQQIIGK